MNYEVKQVGAFLLSFYCGVFLLACCPQNNTKAKNQSNTIVQRTDEEAMEEIVSNKRAAIGIAKAILLNDYSYDSLDNKSYVFEAKLVDDSVWIVRGYQKNVIGGTFYIKIRKSDCRVLKIARGK